MHAHISTRSRDCDGEYLGGYAMPMTHEESIGSFGEIDFKQRIIASVISVYAENGRLDVRAGAVSWVEQTEEGYREAFVEWCEHDCDVNLKQWFRDLRAEEAGY